MGRCEEDVGAQNVECSEICVLVREEEGEKVER
jgi:hypothetical protein